MVWGLNVVQPFSLASLGHSNGRLHGCRRKRKLLSWFFLAQHFRMLFVANVTSSATVI